jgi:hypothetical protein
VWVVEWNSGNFWATSSNEQAEGWKEIKEYKATYEATLKQV